MEPITEERAARTLYRIELLRKVREQVLKCPQLHERLKLCRPSLYLPVWWECGKHDRDLLIGTAKHGLNRTDYYIMNDPQLSFLDAYRNYAQNKRTGLPAPETLCCLYQTNSKLYSSPLYSQVDRTCESLENEAESQIKLEAVDNTMSQAGGSPLDANCETFMSKVQDIMSSNYDESSLPDSLVCMMYDEKACNSEQSSLARDSPSCPDVGSSVAKLSEGKLEGDEDPSSCDADAMRETPFLEGLQVGCDRMDSQNEEAEPSPSTPGSDPSQSVPAELCEALQQKGDLTSPASVLPEHAAMEGVISMGLYSPTLHNYEIKVPPEQRFINLLQEKGMEAKSGLSQSHSEEDEEEEEDDDNSEAAADAVEILSAPRTRAVCDPEANELGGEEQSSGLRTPEDTCPEDVNGERESLGLGTPEGLGKPGTVGQEDHGLSEASTLQHSPRQAHGQAFSLPAPMLGRPGAEHPLAGEEAWGRGAEGQAGYRDALHPEPQGVKQEEHENRDDVEKASSSQSQGMVLRAPSMHLLWGGRDLLTSWQSHRLEGAEPTGAHSSWCDWGTKGWWLCLPEPPTVSPSSPSAMSIPWNAGHPSLPSKGQCLKALAFRKESCLREPVVWGWSGNGGHCSRVPQTQPRGMFALPEQCGLPAMTQG